MRALQLVVLGILLAAAAVGSPIARAATFPIDYSDPASDVVRLNATTGLCEVDAGGNCRMSPQPNEVNLLWLRGRETGAGNSLYNLTIQVQGRIRDYANTTYVVNLYTDATNATHWIVNYTYARLLLKTNATGATPVDITGNATVWGLNPTAPNSLSIVVDKALLGGPSNVSASVDIDATAIMRGDPALGQRYTFQDFGWEVPGRPGTSPTSLNGHVYVRGTTTPIAGATVSASNGASVGTNATGFYELSMTPGTFNVTVSAAGYSAATISVTLTLGQTLTRDVELDRAPIAGLDGALVPLVIVGLGAVIGGLIFMFWKRRKRTDEPG